MEKKKVMLKAINLKMRFLLPISLAISCFSLPVLAQQGGSLANSIQTCAKLTSDQKRLSCFDNIAAPLVAAPIKEFVAPITEPIVVQEVTEVDAVVVSSKPSQTTTPSQISTQQEDEFAKEHLEKTAEQKAEEINSIELTIASLKKLIRGQWKISFDNGQKWQQKDSASIRLKIGDSVVLERGALGVFYLKKSGTKKRIQVKRLK